MRSDESLGAEFRDSGSWTTDPTTGQFSPQLDRLRHFQGPDYHRHPYSGYERNKFFLNRGGTTFDDISGISGADTPADSRTWCLLDYNKDGWQDIALVNANKPLLNLFENRIGNTVDPERNFIAVRFVGGNDSGTPRADATNRDGIGTVVTVRAAGRTLTRHHVCGSGFAAHNSTTMLVGIGSANQADEISVRWPSGITHVVKPVIAGSLVTAFERTHPDTDESTPNFTIRPYNP